MIQVATPHTSLATKLFLEAVWIKVHKVGVLIRLWYLFNFSDLGYHR